MDGRSVTTEGLPPVAVIPSIGAGVSGVLVLISAVIYRLGTDGITGTALLALSGLTFVLFTARRHGKVDRTSAAVLIVPTGLAIAGIGGYLIARGTTAVVSIPGISWEPSLQSVAMLVSVTVIGIAVADGMAVSPAGFFRRMSQLLTVSMIALVGVISAALFVDMFVLGGRFIIGDLTPWERIVVEQTGFGIGIAIVIVGYLAIVHGSLSYLDIEMPALAQIGWIIVGVVALIATVVGLTQLIEFLGVETTRHARVEQATQTPEVILALILTSIVIIGPVEELLFRNIVQKHLYSTYSWMSAIVLTSVIFALLHYGAFTAAGIGGAATGLFVVFVLSLILGYIYYRTENVVIPAAIHGIYNASVFLSVYLPIA